jgi:type VI secretion system protein ImpG
MFKDYFQQEMNQLRELGAEFSKKHPAMAPMLSGPVADPDVERLNEAVAFQTAMLRRKLDDDFPEIIQGLIRIIWPQYLRPVPASTTVAFTPHQPLTAAAPIPAGSTMHSVNVEGIPCIFRTCFDVEVHPLSIIDACFDQPAGAAPHVKMVMELNGIKLSDWKVKSLRFFLSGEYAGASDMYYLLMRNLKAVTIKPLDGGGSITLPAGFLKDAGFTDESSLIPYPAHAFPGYRIIQEYFYMPEKFLYVDLSGWEQWHNRGNGSRFEVYFEFDTLPVRPPRVTRDSFVLFATPAINVFEHHAEPILYDHRAPRYLLRPVCSRPEYYQIFSIEHVSGKPQGSGSERIYKPFEFFRRDMDSSPVYYTAYHPSIIRTEPDVHLSISYERGTIPQGETISTVLQCTNGILPESLRIGDICINKGTAPKFVKFSNIKPITPSVSAPLDVNMLWKLLSLMSLNYLSLQSADNFRSVLEFYIFPNSRNKLAVTANEKRIRAIESVEDNPCDLLFKGVMLRGREVTMKVRSDNFISTGDMYIFGSALDNFLGGYASMNSFTQLIFRETMNGETYKWPARLGRQPLI